MKLAHLLVASLAALSLIACGEDEEETTPVASPDAQTVADTQGSSDAGVADTATPEDTVTNTDVGAADVADVPEGDSAADAEADTATPEDTAVVEDTTADTASTGDVASSDAAMEDATAGDTTMAEPPTYSQIHEAFFGGDGCGNGYCHGGGAGGFSISDETGTHFALVNQNAITPLCGLTQLVVPGDPESSLLWRRVRPIALDGDDLCAPKMPQGSEGMDAESAQMIYDWIAAGALP